MYRGLDYYNYDNNNYNIPSFISKDESDMYDPYNGFIRGNMYKSLYNTYKVDAYNLNPSNNKKSLELYIDALCFACNDIKLYLDVYPNDKKMIDIFYNYNKDLEKLKDEYNDKYGPIISSDVKNSIPWSWDNNPWPWEN